MSKTEKITSITFNRTSNIFINAGIVAIYEYLDRCQDEDEFPDYEFDFINDGNSLKVESDNLFELLDKLYYHMGAELYDTSGAKARERIDKYYFEETPFKATPFYKMKTKGLAELITNAPRPFPKLKENQVSFKKLHEGGSEFAKNIENFYREKGLKLKFFEFTDDGLKYNKDAKGDSILYLKEPYITITRLNSIKNSYFEKGEKICSLTGEGYKDLSLVQNTIPFIKGLNNFASLFSSETLKISWKAMYAIRFSPLLFLYKYPSRKKDSKVLLCYGFESSSLEKLHDYYSEFRSMYFTKPELIEENYWCNFKVSSFKQTSKNEEEIQPPSDYLWKSETLFMVIYTMYKRFLLDEEEDISLVGFRAEEFASTMRTKDFEYFNGFKYIIKLIKRLESEGRINFKKVFEGLMINAPSTGQKMDTGKVKLLERKFRASILDNVLSGKSILAEMALFYYQCYGNYLNSKAPTFSDYRDFYQLTNFTIFYEKLINKLMDKELQKKAFDLGHFIGKSIVESSDGTPKENAKNGRKYIIHLQKARTLEQFNTAIARIQNKYLHQVNGSVFREDIDESNFILIKQFAIIGALNKVNSILKPIEKKKNNKNEKK